MRVLKIGILNKKKRILFISVIFLASFCLLIPPALGYGYDFSNAEIKPNGTFYETLASYDYYAYYRVNCMPGDYLYVEITVSYPTYDADLILYDEYQGIVDSSSISGSYDYVSEDVYSTTHYYIRIERIIPSSGTSIAFTLYISGATGLVIPGFEIISLLIAVISVIGVIYLQVKRKKKTIF